jgi:hypothetical protein
VRADRNLRDNDAVTDISKDAPDETPAVAPARARRAAVKPDAVGLAAVELAREAAVEVGEDTVGDWLGAHPEGDRQVLHSFAATLPGYVGWHWAVSVVRAPRARIATVSEVVLLPGADALRPPDWVPWNERIRPGDLRPGDLLPTAEDDARLVPGYTLSGDPAVDGIDARGDADPDVSLPVDGSVGTAVAREWGFGRARVMSALGRDDAAERWLEGDGGPDNPIARQAQDHCVTCGFFLPLAGSLGVLFGACGNELSPSDGRVVSLDHGCGAHSESLVVAPGA